MKRSLRRFFSATPVWWINVLAVTAGVAAALGQAPWSISSVSLLGFVGIFILLRQVAGWGQAAWLGWFFGAGYFALALFWIVEPFLVDIPRHGWMAPFALFFLAGGLALLWALAFGLAAICASPRWALVVTLTAMEMLRSVLFTGFPWASIGHIWIGTTIMPLASLAGAGALTLTTLIFAAFIGGIARPDKTWPSRYIIIPAQGVLTALVLIFATATPDFETVVTDKTVRLVQINAPQHLKWDPDQIPVFFGRHLSLSEGEASAPRPDAILWPETSIPYRLDRAQDALDYMADAARGTTLVFGANDFVDGEYRNTLAVMGADGGIEDKYYKHHLVPFGEYIPFGDLFATIGIRGLAARDGGGFGPGEGPRLIEIPGLGTALPLICYELIFPRNLRGLPRPDMIVQITNDAWFGNISGPYQHLAQARLRAVEQGLPVIRVANTGVSAVIGPNGETVAQTELNEIAVLDARIPKANTPTLYAKFGDWPILALLGALLVLLLSGRTLRND